MPVYSVTAAQLTDMQKSRTLRIQEENANNRDIKITPKDIGTTNKISQISSDYTYWIVALLGGRSVDKMRSLVLT
jgi:hypothetical protein